MVILIKVFPPCLSGETEENYGNLQLEYRYYGQYWKLHHQMCNKSRPLRLKQHIFINKNLHNEFVFVLGWRPTQEFGGKEIPRKEGKCC
jgi:hypothetical protein